MEMSQETRVRMGAKQTAKGTIQLDLTAEAPDVETAQRLLGNAVDGIVAEIEKRGLVPAHKA